MAKNRLTFGGVLKQNERWIPTTFTPTEHARLVSRGRSAGHLFFAESFTRCLSLLNFIHIYLRTCYYDRNLKQKKVVGFLCVCLLIVLFHLHIHVSWSLMLQFLL